MPDRTTLELRLLRIYGGAATVLLTVFALSAFRQATQRARFTEIDVERINLVEKDGKLRMVISNRDRSPGPIGYGKPFGYPGGTRPGIIFFNDEETENGGLTFSGKTEEGKFSAVGHLSFDQYNQDQVLYLQYIDNNGQRRMGLTVADRADVSIMEWVAQRDSINRLPDGPEKTEALRKLREPRNGVPLFAERVYVGRTVAKAAVVNLSDRNGKPRIRMQVDSMGTASLEFLDEQGRVLSRLPDAGR
jgi:hypothetical protein